MSFMTDGTKSVGDWSAGDFIFIFILSFLITTIVYYFREESKYTQTYINGLIECFIFTTIIVALIYYLLKQRAYLNMSYIVQDKIIMLGTLLFIMLVAVVMLSHIYKNRNSPSGFVIALISVIIVITAFLIAAASSTVGILLNTDQLNYQSLLFASRFPRKPKKRNTEAALNAASFLSKNNTTVL